MNWIHMTKDRVKWRSLVNTVIYCLLICLLVYLFSFNREALQLHEAYTMKYKTCMLYENKKTKEKLRTFK
jgi:hypothetical protein